MRLWSLSDEQERAFADIRGVIESARTIAICAHMNPDGDALGSELALAAAIEQLWPDKEVACLLADDVPCPRMYAFLEGSERLMPAKEYGGSPDLFICVDLSKASRLGDAESVLERSARSIVIDHHPGDDPFWDAGCVRTDAAAAGVLVAQLADFLGAELTQKIAESLLVAIVTDTGRFQYQNADPEAFAVAGALVGAGADPSLISNEVYQSDRLAYLHLESKVMGRIITFAGGRIAYSYATDEDIESLGVELSECEGLVDVVRRTRGAEIALFLKEQGDGSVRGNLRAKGDADVSSVARELGGGGHRAAAGFTIDGGIDDVLLSVLPKLRALIAAETGEGA